MQIGIGLPNQVRDVRPAVIPEWAARAEKAGFSTLGTFGRIAYPGVMDTVALAAAAGATSTIGLLSNILIGPAWPPVLLAKEAAGIDGWSAWNRVGSPLVRPRSRGCSGRAWEPRSKMGAPRRGCLEILRRQLAQCVSSAASSSGSSARTPPRGLAWEGDRVKSRLASRR